MIRLEASVRETERARQDGTPGDLRERGLLTLSAIEAAEPRFQRLGERRLRGKPVRALFLSVVNLVRVRGCRARRCIGDGIALCVENHRTNVARIGIVVGRNEDERVMDRLHFVTRVVMCREFRIVGPHVRREVWALDSANNPQVIRAVHWRTDGVARLAVGGRQVDGIQFSVVGLTGHFLLTLVG